MISLYIRNGKNIDGHEANMQFDSEINLFRGEFTNSHGSADFYAPDLVGFHKKANYCWECCLPYMREVEVK